MPKKKPLLSESTIRELIEFEKAYFEFFQENVRDRKGLENFQEEKIHHEYVQWLGSSPALIGTFHMHGNSVLPALLATLCSTMGETETAEFIQEASK